MQLLLSLVIATLFGFWARSIAVKKGRSGMIFWLGFFLPLIGVIVAACLSERAPETYYSPSSSYDNAPASGENPATPLSAAEGSGSGASGAAEPKWVTCSNCGDRCTFYFARIRKACARCGTPYDLEKAIAESRASTEEAADSAPPEVAETDQKAPPTTLEASGQSDSEGAAL